MKMKTQTWKMVNIIIWMKTKGGLIIPFLKLKGKAMQAWKKPNKLEHKHFNKS